MKRKEYVVFGLGRFGMSVAMQLNKLGCGVLAVDSDQARINEVADYVTHAVCVGTSSFEDLKEIDGKGLDGAIIGIGENLEGAILAILWAKEQGIPLIVCKANDELKGQILLKVGADRIVYPEAEVGHNLATNLVYNNMLDAVELGEGYSIADVPVPQKWIGSSLFELKLREKYGVNVIGIKSLGKFEPAIDVKKSLLDGDVLVTLGSNEIFDKIKKVTE